MSTIWAGHNTVSWSSSEGDIKTASPQDRSTGWQEHKGPFPTTLGALHWNPARIEYFRQLSNTPGAVHTLQCGSLIVQNCLDTGDLIPETTEKQYRAWKKPLFLILKLLLFVEDGEMFPILGCSGCAEMIPFVHLTFHQNKANLMRQLCTHAFVGTELISKDWRERWEIPDVDLIETENFVFHNELESETENKTEVTPLLQHPKLTAVQMSGNLSILFTINNRQKTPFCSLHPSYNCICSKTAKAHFKKTKEENKAQLINNFNGVNSPKNKTKLEETEEAFNVNSFCGYNEENINLPLKDNEKTLWQSNNNLKFDLPEEIVPVYNPEKKCKLHESPYDPNDLNCMSESKNIIIYTYTNEIILHCKVKARPTLGPCKCHQRVCGHKYGLWHLGLGKFVDYNFLLHWLLAWRGGGDPVHNEHAARAQKMRQIGTETTLTRQELNKAAMGFKSKVKFDDMSTFVCPRCGLYPKYLVCDGKCSGLSKKMLNGVSELDKADDDDEVLQQGTVASQRNFLSSSREQGKSASPSP